ncbi:hypothetical protein [Algoriphagus pacificus]|uniref:TerB family tellurite resistance protein n=1 Tax=Algoriphagus pacificus TaxID=2811234 RepID=A0ABS3CK41_9BACT|nr:hypothetical protein [Algoriphagus pacificus]MBN7817474.1 hypothetical protein [Algoriphagus pacificus]
MDWKTKVIIGFVWMLCLGWQTVRGQTWEEWTMQKKLQTSYKTKHLLFMKNFEKYLKEGFDIVSIGLSGIKEIQNEALIAHSDYFKSLEVVSPELAENPKVQAIHHNYTQVHLVNDWIKTMVQDSQRLKSDEKESALQLSDALLNTSHAVLENLEMVLKTGRHQLSENERLEVIDACFLQMGSLNSEIKSAFNTLLVLEKGRSNTLKEQQIIRSLYE